MKTLVIYSELRIQEGTVIEETDKVLSLKVGNGRVLRIQKENILSRRTKE